MTLSRVSHAHAYAHCRYSVYNVVFMRLKQLEGGKLTQRAAATVKVAAVIYFSIWIGFPILWLMLEFKLIGHSLQLCMHAVLDVLCKSLYGFILLSFQLECEREEYIFLPLQPSIPEDENKSEGEGADGTDVELGYTFTEGGFKPNYVPSGPIVGSSKQRKMSREILSQARQQDSEARSTGSRSPTFTPRGYVNSSTNPYASANGYGGNSTVIPPGNNMDESAILRQIQALNAQLNGMVEDGDRRAI